MEKKSEKLKNRSPVVVVMGHIDHGKSTLLDYIRKSNIAADEAGGITQKMSAYEVVLPPISAEGDIPLINAEKNAPLIDAENKKIASDIHTSTKKITFLDTPGHEAFKAMRERGARVADIAILVVAADDGVKPQTLEALSCIKEEKMPFIVAINKIDKPGANVAKTQNTLAEHGIYLEGQGGDVPGVLISAKTGEHIPELLELIGLVAEMEDLKGDTESPAEGFVLESNLHPQKGINATVIIKNGSLKNGLYVSAGDSVAPIRMMENFRGEKIDYACFSSPVKITGWNKIPKVGVIFKTFKTKKEAENEAKDFVEKTAVKKADSPKETLLETMTIPIVIKADTEGSLEAITHEIDKLKNDKIEFKIINGSIGIISESDIKNASMEKKPIILGFNTKIDPQAKNFAEREGVTIKIFDVIYKITEWLKTDLVSLLPKVDVEEITGKAQIIKIFGTEKEKQIIGGKVVEGVIEVGGLFRINRRTNVIGTGKIRELQQKTAVIKEVKEGNEFGALVEAKVPISATDLLEFYKITKQPIKI